MPSISRGKSLKNDGGKGRNTNDRVRLCLFPDMERGSKQRKRLIELDFFKVVLFGWSTGRKNGGQNKTSKSMRVQKKDQLRMFTYSDGVGEPVWRRERARVVEIS